MKRGRGRIVDRQFKNRLEAAWADELNAQLKAGQILRWGYEEMTLVLADGTRYTPDFIVMLPDTTFQVHETKGYTTGRMAASMVRLRVAASRFGWFGEFYLVQRVRKRWKIPKVGR